MSQQCVSTHAQLDSLRHLQLENNELKKYIVAQKTVITSLERRVGRSLESLGIHVERLTDSQYESPDWGNQLELVQNEINCLCDLISDTMLLQKLEAGKVEVKLEPLELHSVLTSASRHLREPRENNQIRLVCDIDPALSSVLADQELTEAVVLDLVARGLKYSDQTLPVVLAAEQDEKYVYTKVTAQRFAPAGDRDFATEIVLCCRRIEVQGGSVTCQSHPNGLQTVTIALNTVSTADH